MNLKRIIIFSMLILITLSAVSAENETATNTHNSDINDTKYINPNDYYNDENGEMIPYTSDVGSYNNVTMSNGYNAYAIQNGGYIESNDSKTHPSFWNDTFLVVEANDTQTVVGHVYYTNSTPTGEYLKILFFKHYDDLLKLNKNSPNVPSSIYVQSFIWDFYKNGGNISNLLYRYNREAVMLYNQGYRVNNTGNVQWINETAYRIFDFSAFRNFNSTHKDLWGFKITLFNMSINDDNNTNISNSNSTELNNTNKTKIESKNMTKTNSSHTNHKHDKTHKTCVKRSNKNQSDESEKIDLIKKTGNNVGLFLILLVVILIILIAKSVKE